MRSIQLNKKKGMSIGDMYPAVLTIVLIGIILGVGLFVLSTLHDSIAVDYTQIQVDINTSTGTTTLANASLTNYNLGSLTGEFANGTSFTNFTFTSAGVVTWGADVVADQTKLINATATFKYDASSTPETAITTTITGLAGFADWIAIIVVVIAAAIVLGVVLSSFGTGRNII